MGDTTGQSRQNKKQQHIFYAITQCLNIVWVFGIFVAHRIIRGMQCLVADEVSQKGWYTRDH